MSFSPASLQCVLLQLQVFVLLISTTGSEWPECQQREKSCPVFHSFSVFLPSVSMAASNTLLNLAAPKYGLVWHLKPSHHLTGLHKSSSGWWTNCTFTLWSFTGSDFYGDLGDPLTRQCKIEPSFCLTSKENWLYWFVQVLISFYFSSGLALVTVSLGFWIITSEVVWRPHCDFGQRFSLSFFFFF